MVFAANITAKHRLQLNRLKRLDPVPDSKYDMVAVTGFGHLNGIYL
jgi:hypothetical protein